MPLKRIVDLIGLGDPDAIELIREIVRQHRGR